MVSYYRTILVLATQVLALGGRQVFAQDNIGLRFVFGTLHPGGDAMAFLQPRKLDTEAVAVLNWGCIVSYERYIYKKRLAVKVAHGTYSDCALVLMFLYIFTLKPGISSAIGETINIAMFSRSRLRQI